MSMIFNKKKFELMEFWRYEQPNKWGRLSMEINKCKSKNIINWLPNLRRRIQSPIMHNLFPTLPLQIWKLAIWAHHVHMLASFFEINEESTC